MVAAQACRCGTHTASAHITAIAGPMNRQPNVPAWRKATPSRRSFDPATLPSIELINAISDIRAFLAPGVPMNLPARRFDAPGYPIPRYAISSASQKTSGILPTPTECPVSDRSNSRPNCVPWSLACSATDRSKPHRSNRMPIRPNEFLKRPDGRGPRRKLWHSLRKVPVVNRHTRPPTSLHLLVRPQSSLG